MDRIKRRKNYYTPGIISLTILPFVLMYFANKEIKARTVGVIPIFLANTSLAKKYPEWFTKFRGHFPPERNYVDIDFTGNIQNDKTNLDFAQLRIRKTLLQNDSTNGVHFIFSNNSQYGTFVKAIDILRFEGAKSYMSLDYDLWFYHFPIDTSTKQSDIKCFLCNDVVIIEPKKSWWTTATEETKQIWHSSWQIILGFSAFLLSILILRQMKNGS
jgi:biopolymer transport protein ExbD